MSLDKFVQLEMLSCSWKWFYVIRQVCAIGNALKKLETILCKVWRIYVTGDALMLLKTFYASFDGSVRLEMLLSSWKRFYEYERICETWNALMQMEMILCKFGQISVTGNPFHWLTVGRNSILNFPARIRTGMCRASLLGWWLITQRSSWPSEAILYGVSLRVDF